MPNKAVDTPQMELLHQLMNTDLLNDYSLVGGTNLALRYQHRKSIDLDLFRFHTSPSQIENEHLIQQLKQALPNEDIFISHINKIGAFLFINDIKVDLIDYPYPFILPIETIDNVRMAHPLDIGAMKINAITNRGSKKDFYDIHELLKHFSFQEIFDVVQQKMPYVSAIIGRSLLYFQDAEDLSDRNNYVNSLLQESWNDIKNNIHQKYSEFIRQNRKSLRH